MVLPTHPELTVRRVRPIAEHNCDSVCVHCGFNGCNIISKLQTITIGLIIFHYVYRILAPRVAIISILIVVQLTQINLFHTDKFSDDTEAFPTEKLILKQKCVILRHMQFVQWTVYCAQLHIVDLFGLLWLTVNLTILQKLNQFIWIHLYLLPRFPQGCAHWSCSS